MIEKVTRNNGKSLLFVPDGNTVIGEFEVSNDYPGFATFAYFGSGDSLCVPYQEWSEFKELIIAMDEYVMKRIDYAAKVNTETNSGSNE